MKAIGHFRTITKHKMLVMKYCFKIGLYKQGFLHDLSKYTPVEFFAGCKYYQEGARSPNNAQREIMGYSAAWLNHKGRNKHHNEYWIDYGLNTPEPIVGVKMPRKYMAEMIIDRMCASMNYEKSNYNARSSLLYYERGKDKMIMHEKSKIELEFLLHKLADEGEEVLLSYLKKVYLKKKETKSVIA
jgi:hypothetical protein